MVILLVIWSLSFAILAGVWSRSGEDRRYSAAEGVPLWALYGMVALAAPVLLALVIVQMGRWGEDE